jgi:IclR family pca regulon transcriptional regulator
VRADRPPASPSVVAGAADPHAATAGRDGADRAVEFVQSLARGIAVIRSFSDEAPRQTLADTARATGLTRATCRRLLLTLVELGYARTDGKHYELTPRVLDIGYSYLASMQLNDVAQPFIERFSENVHESSSISVLDDTDIVYVARVPTKRIMTVAIGLGSRFPAYKTSMGRVLLAELDDRVIADNFQRSRRDTATVHTVSSSTALLDAIGAVRANGWALVDQELEIGIRSVAAPIRDARGRAIAAVNVSTHAGRTDVAEIHQTFLPQLLETAALISDALARR